MVILTQHSDLLREEVGESIDANVTQSYDTDLLTFHLKIEAKNIAKLKDEIISMPMIQRAFLESNKQLNDLSDTNAALREKINELMPYKTLWEMNYEMKHGEKRKDAQEEK